MLDPLLGLALLGLSFEKKFFHPSHRQALGQIIEGTVRRTLMAGAVGLAAFSEASDEGGAQNIGMDLEELEEAGFAFSQSEGGTADGMYPSHI